MKIKVEAWLNSSSDFRGRSFHCDECTQFYGFINTYSEEPSCWKVQQYLILYREHHIRIYDTLRILFLLTL